MRRYGDAIDAGLLKIMSKMGISVISSYRGGLNFEAVGLSRAMVAEYFPGMQSRISGIGLAGIQMKVEEVHAKGWLGGTDVLPIGGFYKARRSGEKHAWEAQTMHMLQSACDRASFDIWKQYSAAMRSNPPIHIRDLLDIKTLGKPVPIEEVESHHLDPQTVRDAGHVAGRAGARGAQDPERRDEPHRRQVRLRRGRRRPGALPAGTQWRQPIGQDQTGRLGSFWCHRRIPERLRRAGDQSRPGCQARRRRPVARHESDRADRPPAPFHPRRDADHPPPHHDIYSIEDLAQLIYDLKQINPRAKVTVKLVRQSGVGTIAAGVAKAKADMILISGHNGGTGASPATSIKYAGLPWEMGLTEAHQVLSMNNLRERVTLRTDGGLRTGPRCGDGRHAGGRGIRHRHRRPDRHGLHHGASVPEQHLPGRRLHARHQPLRAKFTGTADKVVNLITFYAQEVREILASIGARSMDEIIGRADLLSQVSPRGCASG